MEQYSADIDNVKRGKIVAWSPEEVLPSLSIARYLCATFEHCNESGLECRYLASHHIASCHQEHEIVHLNLEKCGSCTCTQRQAGPITHTEAHTPSKDNTCTY